MIFRDNNIGVAQSLMKLQPRCGARIYIPYMGVKRASPQIFIVI